ncbi:hypothetical protein JTB14_033707 [Gonioctena quinquepunctata]|nr:hypothetical protein JTB14_033707 [Gonioctena quinquepunctata]
MEMSMSRCKIRTAEPRAQLVLSNKLRVHTDKFLSEYFSSTLKTLCLNLAGYAEVLFQNCDYYPHTSPKSSTKYPEGNPIPVISRNNEYKQLDCVYHGENSMQNAANRERG